MYQLHKHLTNIEYWNHTLEDCMPKNRRSRRLPLGVLRTMRIASGWSTSGSGGISRASSSFLRWRSWINWRRIAKYYYHRQILIVFRSPDAKSEHRISLTFSDKNNLRKHNRPLFSDHKLYLKVASLKQITAIILQVTAAWEWQHNHS